MLHQPLFGWRETVTEEAVEITTAAPLTTYQLGQTDRMQPPQAALTTRLQPPMLLGDQRLLALLGIAHTDPHNPALKPTRAVSKLSWGPPSICAC